MSRRKKKYRITNRFIEFEKLCKLSQKQMKAYLHRELCEKYETVINEDGYLFAKGTIPVMLLAHMDTVHKELPKWFEYKDKGNIISSPQGIGGDDRCGIYMILQIIKELHCSVLFLEDEEIGCVGANDFAYDYEHNLIPEAKEANIKYMIEFDRRGSKDAVYYDLDNTEFEDWITEASGGHFVTNYGSCSDISYVAPAMKVAAVNLSCGYYKEHTLEHWVNRREMETNIEKAKMIIKTAAEKPFEWKEIKFDWTKYYKSKYGSKYSTYFDDDYGYGGYGYGDYDYDYGYKTDKAKSKAEQIEYEIIFIDDDDSDAVDYFYGDSIYEALGKFMEAHPTTKYNDVYEICETQGSDYSCTVQRYYCNGDLVGITNPKLKEVIDA